ncbi:MAG: septum formation initiator [Campylobacterales bacterium]|nr:septum formation initiator [Campylobacterales bacterium]
MIEKLRHNKKFILTTLLSVVLTLFFALYVANLLYGKNSYSVYSQLQLKKAQLQEDINRLQLENANLQKQYLELKNLEPEQL